MRRIRSSRPRAKLLLVLRDGRQRGLLAATLRDEGYDVVEVEDVVELAGYLGDGLGSSERRDLPALLIADADFAGEPGFDILTHLRRSHQRIPVILLSDAPDRELQNEGRHLGASYVFSKPCEMADLLVGVWSLVDPQGHSRAQSQRGWRRWHRGSPCVADRRPAGEIEALTDDHERRV
jgi:DNA-binding response OmpR family regulator